MVNLVFEIDNNALLNLQGEMDVPGEPDTIRIRIAHRQDIDWMIDGKLVDVPCRLENPDGSGHKVVFHSFEVMEEGFVLQGRLFNGKKRVIKQGVS